MNEEVVELRLKKGRKKGEQETLLYIVQFGSPGYWSIWFIQRTGTAQLTTVQIREKVHPIYQENLFYLICFRTYPPHPSPPDLGSSSPANTFPIHRTDTLLQQDPEMPAADAS
ncbi:unnamed protein product [Caretta caretta]